MDCCWKRTRQILGPTNRLTTKRRLLANLTDRHARHGHHTNTPQQQQQQEEEEEEEEEEGKTQYNTRLPISDFSFPSMYSPSIMP